MASIRKISALSLAALILQAIAPAVLAAGPCAVTALDTVAGLGTEVSIANCASGANAALTLHRPGNNEDYVQTIALDANGSALTLIPSKYTTTAGLYDVTVAGEKTTFTVMADRADDARSSLTLPRTTLRGDGQDTLTVTASLRDRYDNPVAGRPLALMTSRLSDEVTAESRQTDDEGRFLWTVRSTQAGTTTLIPYDILSGRQLKLRLDITVVNSTVASNTSLRGALIGTELGGNLMQEADLTNSGIADRFELALPLGATDVKANDLFSVTIRAMRGSELVRGYVGTLIVSSSDPDAELPKKGADPKSPDTGSIDIRPVDQGERKVPLSFVLRRIGTQTINVSDKAEPSVTGQLTLNVVRADGSPNDKIEILDPKDRSKIKGDPNSVIHLQGKAPSLVNLTVKGGKEVVQGESDAEGVFRIDVPLNPEDREVTLFVESENGTYESDPVHIIIDNEAPKISSIIFDQPEGITGEPATVTVKTDADVTTITGLFNEQEVTFTGTEGLFSAIVTAPAQEGVYAIAITANDSVGNTAQMSAQWIIKPKVIPIVEVPVVKGVTAESLPSEVLIKWQPITEVPVTGYKVYVAKAGDPKNYLYSLGPTELVTSVRIRNLPIGDSYQFSLTAMNAEGRESPEKSKPVTAAALGLTLTAKPGKDSILLEWKSIAELPMNHYILQFGTEPGVYTETRTVNGDAQSFIIHDLLGNTTYEFKLTPVTVTGKTMEELAVTVRSTVAGEGFTTGPSDPVPPEIIGHPGAPSVPSPLPTPIDTPPPSTPDSGIPSPIVWSAFAVAVLLFGLHLRRIRLEREQTKKFLSLMQQRYSS